MNFLVDDIRTHVKSYILNSHIFFKGWQCEEDNAK